MVSLNWDGTWDRLNILMPSCQYKNSHCKDKTEILYLERRSLYWILSRNPDLRRRFRTRYAGNTGWWEIDIHGCYPLVQIAFAPICACKSNRRIWRHNANIPRSCDVRDQLWWRHNAKSDRPLWQWRNQRSIIVFSGIVCSGHKIACER